MARGTDRKQARVADKSAIAIRYIFIVFVIFGPFNSIMFKYKLLLLCCFHASTWGQTKTAGPVIPDYGKVFKVENIGYPTDTSRGFKVVFDVMESAESPGEINMHLETAARFLNMHAQNGVPPEQLKLYIVVHNEATRDLFTNDAYKVRFGMENPNAQLIKELLNAGVGIILCGQSATARNVAARDAIDGVVLALSAMTALVQLQDEGYQVIKF